MIDLHYWPTPNGKKVSIFLEETGTPYRLIPVNISVGDQFKPEFLKLNPNHRMPAIVDHAPKRRRGADQRLRVGRYPVLSCRKDRQVLAAGSAQANTTSPSG